MCPVWSGLDRIRIISKNDVNDDNHEKIGKIKKEV